MRIELQDRLDNMIVDVEDVIQSQESGEQTEVYETDELYAPNPPLREI